MKTKGEITCQRIRAIFKKEGLSAQTSYPGMIGRNYTDGFTVRDKSVNFPGKFPKAPQMPVAEWSWSSSVARGRSEGNGARTDEMKAALLKHGITCDKTGNALWFKLENFRWADVE